MSERKVSNKEIKELYASLGRSLFLCFVALFAIVAVTVAWFVNNTSVNSGSSTISPLGIEPFELATIGSKEQGIYDSILRLSGDLRSETIDGVEYRIASSNSSLRVNPGKNVNNYYNNQDLRPGNRGSFDIYVICRGTEREFQLQPVFKAYFEDESGSLVLSDNEKFVYGHILFFTNMDDRGMYSGAINMSNVIKVDLTNADSNQGVGEATQGNRTYPWGVLKGSDGNGRVYKLTVFWVWPEQFGNFIYTGNSYNKNLFKEHGADFNYYKYLMESNITYSLFFNGALAENRPSIDTIIGDNIDFKTATENYNLYSSWYDSADEWIGEYVNYLEIGFELVDSNSGSN